MTRALPAGIQITGELTPAVDEVLTPDALEFVAHLHRTFDPRRMALLQRRVERQQEIDGGLVPGFLPETAHIRGGAWQVAPAPADLNDRRVEITGPAERRMMINDLNSGAKVYMADFEDLLAPTWENIIQGQINCSDAIRRTITYTGPDGETTRLNDTTATLVMRARGLHMVEKHVLVDGEPVAASLFDWGLYFWRNARELVQRGSGPYFYLSKLESHQEARLWNDIFNEAQDRVGIPRGTIRATVLIETILAALEMEEILWELREHVAGLNAGRWDYMFSAVKKFARHEALIFPDRAQITMTVPFMRALAQLLIHTCHLHGAHAMGGMSAFIPNRRDPAVTEIALAKVREDKLREFNDGCDGTWVAHPAMVPTVMAVADAALGDKPHQKDRLRADITVTDRDITAVGVPGGQITEAGLRLNVRVALQYLNAWLGGKGAVAINNVIEDVATAEISRSLIWQWIHHNAALEDGRAVTRALYQQIRDEELAALGGAGVERYADAVAILDTLCVTEEFIQFLTPGAYAYYA